MTIVVLSLIGLTAVILYNMNTCIKDMKVTFIIYTKGERTFLWDWNNVNTIPRKDDLIELTALGYGDKGVDKYAVVKNILWKDKNNTEITLEL